MKINRSVLSLIIESVVNDDARFAKIIADNLKEQGSNVESIRQFFELAVGADLAVADTLSFIEMPSFRYPGVIVSFTVKEPLLKALLNVMSRFKYEEVEDSNGEFYKIAYSVY